ncbi:MAG TPA: Xaa-Pro peptidase family protein, partial [Rudaea sp.]
MDRRRFFTAAGTSAALIGLGAERALADERTSTAAHFDAATVQSIRARIRPIAPDELLARQEQARRLMKDNGIDAIFVEGGTALAYFTGLHWWLSERMFAMVLPQRGEPFFISPKFEEGRAREKLGSAAKVYTWEEHEKPIERVRQGMQDHGLLSGTLGVEETTRYYAIEQLQQRLPTVKLRSATPVTAGCRSVKSPHEIELMQVANDITAHVYRQVQRMLREGMGEKELGATIEALYGEFGVQGDALVLFGEASAYPHGLTRDVQLKPGDSVLIDGGCKVEGYGSDITRTMVLGEPSAKMKSVWEIVRGAQDAALKAAR